ncbi:MAG TPA: hypothetical protein VEK85_17130 [Gemmatimonadales bacterium]|nr:hypothetical protein [Gemmatimonadales bacterium]
MSTKRHGRKAPTGKRSPRKAVKSPQRDRFNHPAQAAKAKAAAKRKGKRPRVPQGQEAARIRAGKLSGGAAVAALLPDSSADALDRAIAGEPETLYALQVRNKPGHYLVDANAHPNVKNVTTTLSTALTWRNRTGPNTHLRRHPELAADFIPLRLDVKAKPAPNSLAANEQRARAAQAIKAAAPVEATAPAA